MKLALRWLILVLVIVGISFLVIRLGQISRRTNTPNNSSSIPTPTPLSIRQFVNISKTFTFLYPEDWQIDTTDIYGDATITNIFACGKTTLSVRELPDTDPETKAPLSAEDYLSIKDFVPSKIDDRKAIMITDTSATNSAGFADVVIEATPSGKLIDLYYIPTCGKNMEEGKRTELLPLLDNFIFL